MNTSPSEAHLKQTVEPPAIQKVLPIGDGGINDDGGAGGGDGSGRYNSPYSVTAILLSSLSYSLRNCDHSLRETHGEKP